MTALEGELQKAIEKGQPGRASEDKPSLALWTQLCNVSAWGFASHSLLQFVPQQGSGKPWRKIFVVVEGIYSMEGRGPVDTKPP